MLCTMATMADAPGKPPEIQLQIQLDDDVASGQYVNMALVNHTETEFTLDFIYVQPQQPRAKVRSRIITNPKHMKRLFMAMQDNLAKFEARFGPIEICDAMPSYVNQNKAEWIAKDLRWCPWGSRVLDVVEQ